MLRFFLGCCLLLNALAAQNCANTATGLLPLPELGPQHYQGFPGGLYPGGQNQPPAAHLQEGLSRAAAIQPRNQLGQPDPQGRIVLLSIGMSNATQEFSVWQRRSAADPFRNPRLQLVDGAQGGQDAAVFANPLAPAWSVVDQRLQAAGATAAQVQVVWIKQALMNPVAGFPAHALQLESDLRSITHNLTARFPNLQIAYLSSRTYGGYANNPQRQEPLTYETAFAIQWLIAAQIHGDPALNYSSTAGPVRAPWLAFGPYLWADGLQPRADGLTWACADYQSDGVHPTHFGRYKVAALLDGFFHSEPTAVPWFLGGSGQAIAAVLPIGNGCSGPQGEVALQANGLPQPGNATFRLGASRFGGNQWAALVLGSAIQRTTLAMGCEIYLDLAELWGAQPLQVTNSNGSVQQALPLPNAAGLVGLRFYGQWASLDAAGVPMPGSNIPLLLSPAAEVRIGW